MALIQVLALAEDTKRSENGLREAYTAIMDSDIQSLRREAAAAGRAVMADTLSYDQFMERFADCGDDLISDLVDLIEHEPKRGGVLGVNETDWAQYQSQLASALAVLESA
jgi:hypothetical protein